MRQVFLLQNAAVITNCDSFITKCDVYYKLWQYTGLPKMMVTDRLETFDQSKIANGLNKFFTDIEPKLSSCIPSPFKDFKDFLRAVETDQFRWIPI